MSRIFQKRTKKIGAPPGTLIHIGKKPVEKINISVIEYDAETLIEKHDVSLEECITFINQPTMTWITVKGVYDPETISTIGKAFGLHPLLLEDIMDTNQRPKIDFYDDCLFIVMRMMKIHEERQELENQQVSIVLKAGVIILFLEGNGDVFEGVRERIRKKNPRIRSMGSDYLCYALLDQIVDSYFVILEATDSELDDLDEELLKNPNTRTLHKIQHLRQEIILLKKVIWPTREVMSQFRHMNTPLIQDATKLYMQDLYDHSIQIIDTIESFRDIAAGLLDIYLSNLSHRMNEIMKVLTIVSTLFVPLTFISSLYGMNFKYMPELQWRWGYPIVLAIMATVALGMLRYFRTKRWI